MSTFVVTGSASGIGRATRLRLERDGAEVIGVDLHDAEVVADLATSDGRELAVTTVAQLAPAGLDGCVAAAGIGPHERPVERIVAVNYFGAVAVLAGLADLLADRRGVAVAVASNSAGITPVDPPDVLEAMRAGDEPRALERARSMHGAVLYGASKRALTTWVRGSAERFGAAGVRLNAVAPGPVRTPLLQGSIDDPELGPLVDALPVPWGDAPSEPDQMAGIIAFLLSDSSAPVHGSVLFADGGTDAMMRPDAL
jgi:NAD(P)-dependent dehydrogenase (short-subunit alcohol dehydrogenase family)